MYSFVWSFMLLFYTYIMFVWCFSFFFNKKYISILDFLSINNMKINETYNRLSKLCTLHAKYKNSCHQRFPKYINSKTNKKMWINFYMKCLTTYEIRLNTTKSDRITENEKKFQVLLNFRLIIIFRLYLHRFIHSRVFNRPHFLPTVCNVWTPLVTLVCVFCEPCSFFLIKMWWQN